MCGRLEEVARGGGSHSTVESTARPGSTSPLPGLSLSAKQIISCNLYTVLLNRVLATAHPMLAACPWDPAHAVALQVQHLSGLRSRCMHQRHGCTGHPATPGLVGRWQISSRPYTCFHTRGSVPARPYTCFNTRVTRHFPLHACIGIGAVVPASAYPCPHPLAAERVYPCASRTIPKAIHAPSGPSRANKLSN